MARVNYYHPDDIKTHFKRNRNTSNPTRLRKAIKPGSVLILLAGRFKGRRVVFLKQLESGLLLITGPYKVNGVPLRRVNQAYVQPTSTTLDVSKVAVDDLEDSYFRKTVVKKDISKNVAWASLEKDTEAVKDQLIEKKERQAQVDKALLQEVGKVPMMRKYLATRFSLRKGMKPHDMNF